MTVSHPHVSEDQLAEPQHEGVRGELPLLIWALTIVNAENGEHSKTARRLTIPTKKFSRED